MRFIELSLVSVILVAEYVSYSRAQTYLVEKTTVAVPLTSESEVENVTPTAMPNDDSDDKLRAANEEVCRYGFVDAATRTQDGSTYFFRGDYYWKIDAGIVPGYPKLIAEDWKGVGSGPIDAAFTWNDGSTFLFKNDSYWRFYNLQPEKGYPRKIQDGFRGIPNNIDSALVWESNGLTYFFKGSKYWRYNQKDLNPVNKEYPYDISEWTFKGVPNNISSAIRWVDGQTYFFKGTKYYKFENYEEKVIKSPGQTSKDWFGGEKAGIPDNNKSMLEREISNHEEVMTKIDELKNQVDLIANALKKVEFLKKIEFIKIL